MKKKSSWGFLAQSATGSLVRVTSTAPWAVLRQLRPHSPKPIQTHRAPGLTVCSASIIQGVMDSEPEAAKAAPLAASPQSLALPNTQRINREYLWAASQKDCVPLAFAKVVHFIQSWREGAEQSLWEGFFRQCN